MKFTIDDKLIVAFTSRALFDLEEENRVFEEKGEQAYMRLQQQRMKRPAKPGVALPLAAKLLALNDGRDDDNRVVECVLISRNDPNSAMRVFNSLSYYGINGMVAGSFTNGRDPLKYLAPYKADLFLSANPASVRSALAQGHAAALIYPRVGHLPDPADKEIRLAFDFDGVLADDSSERITALQGLDAFVNNEKDKAKVPMPAGPFRSVLHAFHRLKQDGHPIRNGVFTARLWPENRRILTSLRRWELDVDEVHFTGTAPKAPFLERFAPDMYFDDTPRHVNTAHPRVPTGHVVYGVKNEPGK